MGSTAQDHVASGPFLSVADQEIGTVQFVAVVDVGVLASEVDGSHQPAGADLLVEERHPVERRRGFFEGSLKMRE